MDIPVPIINELDAARIRQLGARLDGPPRGLGALAELIEMVTDGAEVVPAERVPPDVVTVNSTVSFQDLLGGQVHRVTVVYPRDMSIAQRRISVLSPVGRALLGRRVGERVALEMPDGSGRELRITALHYQPEASGDHML